MNFVCDILSKSVRDFLRNCDKQNLFVHNDVTDSWTLFTKISLEQNSLGLPTLSYDRID